MAVYDIHAGEDLYARLSMLQAGDTVTVHAGTYTTPGFYEVTWAGTQAQPILIQAATGEKVILQGTPNQNVFNIAGSFFTLDGFEIKGGSHGLRLKQVSNATISHNTIHDLGDVGISCNFEMNCDALTIRHNEIYDTGHDGTGEGMYLGCNDGSCTLTNSLVVNNYVHDTGGSQGDGIEIKQNSWGNTVADNVIVRPNYPGITMYGITGSHPKNIVERNLVWHTKTDNGIQCAGQILVVNNIVIDAPANGIQSKATPSIPTSDVTIAFNTIISAPTCVKTNDWSAGTGQILANNACTSATDVNGGAGTGAMIDTNQVGTNADVTDAVGGNVYPVPGSRLIDHAVPLYAAMDDFNGTARTAPLDLGAYEVTSATNPGWIPVEGFKDPLPVTGDPPIGDAESPDATQKPGGCCDAGTPSNGLLALLVATLLTWSGRPASTRRRRRA